MLSLSVSIFKPRWRIVGQTDHFHYPRPRAHWRKNVKQNIKRKILEEDHRKQVSNINFSMKWTKVQIRLNRT